MEVSCSDKSKARDCTASHYRHRTQTLSDRNNDGSHAVVVSLNLFSDHVETTHSTAQK